MPGIEIVQLDVNQACSAAADVFNKSVGAGSHLALEVAVATLQPSLLPHSQLRSLSIQEDMGTPGLSMLPQLLAAGSLAQLTALRLRAAHLADSPGL